MDLQSKFGYTEQQLKEKLDAFSKLEEELAEMKKLQTATALNPSAATGVSWSALPVADMLKVVELFGGTAPDITGVQDKKALLAESIAESLLGLADH